MTLDVWSVLVAGVVLGALGAGLGIAALILRAVQAREAIPPTADLLQAHQDRTIFDAMKRRREER